MFESLAQRPSDPILSVGRAYLEDKNPEKVNLGVGVYQSEKGETPIFGNVSSAEEILLKDQQTKAYVDQAGDPLFLHGLTELVLGQKLAATLKGRLAATTTIGGSGALRMAAELVKTAHPGSTVWVSKPTWGNHRPLFSASGLPLIEYPYYEARTQRVDFDRMMVRLAAAKANDVVVLHACCHNPTGADLEPGQWRELFSLMAERGLLPLIDLAYQGFGASLDDDAYAVRLAAETLPEVMVASSCSKNFSMYRERAGMLLLIAATERAVQAANSQVLSIARSAYSMPGYHGPAVVGKLLSDKNLRGGWEAELDAARLRISSLRMRFAAELAELNSSNDFSFVARQSGMFSLLGLSNSEVQRLRQEHSVYLVGASRANLTGLSEPNLTRVVGAVGSVLTG